MAARRLHELLRIRARLCSRGAPVRDRRRRAGESGSVRRGFRCFPAAPARGLGRPGRDGSRSDAARLRGHGGDRPRARVPPPRPRDRPRRGAVGRDARRRIKAVGRTDPSRRRRGGRRGRSCCGPFPICRACSSPITRPGCCSRSARCDTSPRCVRAAVRSTRSRCVATRPRAVNCSRPSTTCGGAT